MMKHEYLQKTAWAGLCAGLYWCLAPSASITVFSGAYAEVLPAAHTGAPFARGGYVLTRGLELGDNGRPIWAEIKSDGSFGRTFGEAVGDYANAKPMSAEAYRGYKQLLDNFKGNNPALARGAYILSREEYDARSDFGKVEVALANPAPGGPQTESVPIAKPADGLPSGIHSVLLRAAETIPDPRLLAAGAGPVLLQFPVDMRPGTYRTLEAGIKSVLLGEHGEVLETSADNIGYKSGYYPEDDPSREGPPLGPVAGVKVDAGVYTFRNLHGTTDDKGRFYYDVWKPGCPGFSYTISFAHWATLMNRNFDPNAPEFLDFTDARAPDYLVCSGYSALLSPMGFEGLIKNNLQSTELNTFYSSTYNADVNPIFVDVVQFTGQARLSNDGVEMIPAGEATEYGYVAPDMNRISTPHLDLNADRREDFTILSGETLAVYLDGAGTNAQGQTVDAEGNVIDRPDLERRADVAPDFEDQGLLTQIAEEDLKKTDLYVYRQSNGQLAVKRHEIDEGFIETTDNQHFWYRLRLPGQSVSNACVGGGICTETRAEAKAAWQEAQGLAEELRPFQSDHLRPGEQVKIIAINRPTGYIGTVTTTIQPPQSGVQDASIDEMVLRPPNLKITAERIYTPQAGLTAGDEQRYRIGFEGSALTSDTLVAIHTEWFDHDGTPLPETLEGYTGRMAKVTGPNSLDGGDVATFEIKPGSHLQVVKFQGDILGSEHFYVHVSGFPEWENPGTGAASQGPLQYRPKHYAPIKVSIYDEAATRQARNANAYNQQAGLDGVDEVPPVYQYPYRPEMQFSVFELQQEQLQLQYEQDGETQTLNLNQVSAETINDLFNGGYDYVDLFYSLLSGQNDPLEALGPSRDLMFAVGEDEMLATFGAGRSLRFDSLDHLAALAVEDYLAIRLYQNNDTANVLWEWAFGIPLEGDALVRFISVDNPSLDLAAYFPIEIDENNLKNISVVWSVSGSGTVVTPITHSGYGVFNNTLIADLAPGKTITVIAEVIQSEDDRVTVGTKHSFGSFEIVAGAPATIELSTNASSVLNDGVDTTLITGRVLDRYKNPVEAGTAIAWSTGYSGELLDEETSVNTDGVVTARYRVGLESNPTEVSLVSGNVTQTLDVQKEEFDYTASLSQTNFAPGQTGIVSITLHQAPEEPLDVFWGNSNGLVNGSSLIFDSTIQALFTIDSLSSREGVISVSIAGVRKELPYSIDLPVLEGSIEFEYAAIASGDQDTYEVETLEGSSHQGVVHDSTATVYGTPGQTVTLSAGGLYTPNHQPIATFPMGGFDVDSDGRNVVIDTIGGLEAVVSGDVSWDETESYIQPGSSLLFGGDGRLTVPQHESLDYNTDLFANIRFKVDKFLPDASLLRKGSNDSSGYELKLVDVDGELFVQARVSTNQGDFTVTSSTPLEAEKWYIAGFQLKQGLLTVGVNSTRNSAIAPGALNNTGFAHQLIIGKDYSGHIDDVKIGQIGGGSGPLVLIDGQAEKEITFDSEGKAMVKITSGTTVVANLGSRVGFSIVTEETTTTNRREQELNYLLAFSRLSFLGGSMSEAYAQSAEQNNQLEGGIAVIDGQAMADAIEMLKKAGKAAFDALKTATQFLFEMTSISDVWQLTKAIYLWMNNRFDEVDKIELAFAGIGLTLTIVTVAVSAGTVGAGAPGSIAAMVSVKAALKVLKGTLKEVFKREPEQILQIGGTVARWSFDLVGKILGGKQGREEAIQQLVDFKDIFIEMITSGSVAAWNLLKALGKSTKGFKTFLNLRKIRKMPCAVAYRHNPNDYLYARYTLLANLGLSEANAAGLCGPSLELKILNAAETLNDVQKHQLSEIAVKLSRASKNYDGFVPMSDKTVDILTDLVKNGQGASIAKFIDNMEDTSLTIMGGFRFDRMGAQVAENGDTAFDVMMDAMKALPLDPRDAYDKAFRQLATPNVSNIRGVYGEAATFKRLKEDPNLKRNDGSEVTIDSNQLRVGRDIEYNGRATVQGVDIEGQKLLDPDQLVDRSFTGTAPSGGPLFAEVKNYTSNYNLAKLTKQTEKHFEANIAREISGATWRNGKPHLHYEWMGEAFVDPATGAAKLGNIQSRIKTVIDQCKKMMKISPFMNVSPKFDCAKDITFFVAGSVIDPLTIKSN